MCAPHRILRRQQTSTLSYGNHGSLTTDDQGNHLSYDPWNRVVAVHRDRDTDNNGTLDQTLHFTQDANFNVTSVVATNGDILQHQVYSAYGEIDWKNGDWTSTSSDSYAQEKLFQGMQYDAAIGWYVTPNRLYRANIAVWNRNDPMGYVDGMNFEWAFANNPINHTDATGLKTIVVAFSGLDIPPGSAHKWIQLWENAAKKGGINGEQDVDYKEYTWQQVQKAYDEKIKDLTTQQEIPGVNTKNTCVRNTIVVLGHSYGGDAAYKFVQMIGKKVLVSNVVTADPRHPPGVPPFDTIPYDEPPFVFHWENFRESQQWIVPPFELFGAPVKGPTAKDNFIELPNASTAHYDIPSDPRVLAAVTAAVRDAGTFKTF